MNKDFLLPREEYAEESLKYGKSPFTFEVDNGKQVLYYFAANHSPDPKNEQYPKLKEYWNKFTKITENKSRIILIEGGLRPLREDEKTAITSSSEGGLITFLANKEKIPVASPDLNDRFVENFDKETALLYWFLSGVDRYRRRPEPRLEFNEWLNKWCEDRKNIVEWKGVDISPDILRNLYRKIIGKEFSENESQNYLVNPNKKVTLINKFARILSDLRDFHIASEIERYWKEGKSIFVVFGSGHLIIQRPALEKILR